MKNILILNGPNLNMLGLREPDIYGDQTLDDIKGLCLEKAQALGMEIDFRQSNHEGVLVEWLQQARGVFDGIVINAAAYTHTSIAIHDALKILDIPIIEVHLSNPKDREEFRHNSYIEPLADEVIAGEGARGYLLALEKLKELL
ncbi:MAG: type II 3-dehydroquinate dehydratase [Rhodospirillales bacterium]|nr:type II 3-dehydroquinate dehydratase [Alphaproteobacteria bacterium]MCB9981462.1 type II 3-dehydroquinate dehydratase [Rhodospirillales bacterium]